MNILIIEDEILIQKSLKKLLSSFVNSNIEFNISGRFCIVDKYNSISLSSSILIPDNDYL